VIDEKGRCCGRKPLKYKGGAWNSPRHPQLFCFRCDRAYDLETGIQIENFAWKKDANGQFIKTIQSGLDDGPLLPGYRPRGRVK